MRKGPLIILVLVSTFSFSCKKENLDKFLINGIVKDHVSGEPVPGVTIYIDAIKSPSGMGIITDGRRKNVGRTTTDSKGHYSVKLQVFDEAERLEFSLNSGRGKAGYCSTQHIIYLEGMDRNENKKQDFTLSATALLQIKFKNTQPVSDSDFFYFIWSDRANGWTRGITKKEICGSVSPSVVIS